MTCTAAKIAWSDRRLHVQVFKTFQVFLMGIIAATLWLRTQTHPISVPDANKCALSDSLYLGSDDKLNSPLVCQFLHMPACPCASDL